MVSHGPSLLADPQKGVRACFWVAKEGRGLFSLALSNQAAQTAIGAKGDHRSLFNETKRDTSGPVEGV
jgi:hypothetical protein